MKKNDIRTLTRLALLVAIELVMKAVGLGSVPVGPLYMSFLTLPIAVGAITMGPAAGAILGGVFGAVSFYDAVTGASAMTGALFQVSPVNTFILCVGMRVLMGVCVGLIFNAVKNFDKPGTWSYLVSAMCAPALNTLFFMGWRDPDYIFGNRKRQVGSALGSGFQWRPASRQQIGSFCSSLAYPLCRHHIRR